MADELTSTQEKVISLFKYIMELNKLRTKTFLSGYYHGDRPPVTVHSA